MDANPAAADDALNQPFELNSVDRSRFDGAGLWIRVIGGVQLTGFIILGLAFALGLVKLLSEPHIAAMVFGKGSMLVLLVVTLYQIVYVVQATMMIGAGRQARFFAASGDRGQLLIACKRLTPVFIIDGVAGLLVLGLQLL